MILLALLALLACERPVETAPCAPDDRDLLVVASTDFTAGAISTLGLDDGDLADPVAPAGADPVVVALDDGRVALLERGNGDVLRLYEPGCWEAPALELGLGDANPHDAVLHDGLLWLSLYDEAALWGLDPADGARVVTVDLSELADDDGSPEPSSLAVHDGRLFVALERLRLPEVEDAGGLVAEVDRAGVVATWPVGPSPSVEATGRGLVVRTGLYGALDGALGVLDPDMGAFEPALTEVELGFDLAGYAEAGGVGVVLGAELDPTDGGSRLLCYGWATGGIAEGPASDAWYRDVVAVGADAWIGVRSGWDLAGSGHGLVPVDVVGCALGPPEPLLLEPFSLAVRRHSVAVGPGSQP